ncbi:MAG TPA: fibronectin type III domain-containing protein [Steroidobacteraceae bacterium]|nr:fibronectin type III domain-containing protein [Steroidobacteraceae bacterium]
MRVDRGARVILIAGVMLIGGALAACDDSGLNSNSTGSGTGTLAQQADGQTPNTSSSDAVTLSWEPPTQNSDGSALMDLRGYKIHYGSESGVYSDTIDLSNPGLTMYVVQNLNAGQYYFAIAAYNSQGTESALSPEMSTIVD